VTERIGIATGYDPALTVRSFADVARRAEQRGYEMAFFSETFWLMRDSVTATAAFGVATERIGLGFTQVVRLRNPVTMAQTAASLDELTGGRIVLCPGACTASHARRFSLPHLDPLGALREWVEAIRLVLSGEPVSYRGRFVAFEDVKLGFAPLRRRVPMWIAATSAAGLRLAGDIGDGVLLNTVASPEYSANAVRIVREAVEKSGRDWNGFEVAQLINTSVDDDRDAAIDAVRWEVASKFVPASFDRQSKPRIRVGEPFIDPATLPALGAAFDAGGMPALAKALPASCVEGLTASGTPDDVRRRIERYREAGVRLPIVRPAAPHQTDRVIDLFAPRQGARPTPRRRPASRRPSAAKPRARPS
jgi:alkanesulfonate monooxygenase SsuD/methylene tetrahydromethanopterin reductase-like flavin-dependent oxidoreductase (luciferase family)